MKTAFAGFAMACALAPFAAQAQQMDTGRVLRATPVIQNVPVPREICSGQPAVCTTQTFHENRAVAYDVVYEYAGRQYSTQMASDPGPTIRLQIGPIAASAPGAPPPTQAAQTEVPAATIVGPDVNTTVTAGPAVYPYPYPVYEPYPYPYYYYPRPYYGPAFGISLNVGRPFYYRGGGYSGRRFR